MKTKTETMPKFWLVWRERSGYSSHKHHSRDSADTEAKRLALQHPDEVFHVLNAAAAFKATISPVTRVKLTAPDPDDGRPF